MFQLTGDNIVIELSERQMEIVRATIALIAEEGVQSFSIRKLARRVGVTEPAIYRHFESKDDLMIKLATFIVHNWREMLGELEVEKLPVIEQARRIFSEVMVYFDQNRDFTKTLLSTDLLANDSGMTAMLLDLEREGVLRFAELLSAGQASGELRQDVDATTVSQIFFGSVWWVTSNWLAGRFATDLAAEWDKMWRVLVALLEKR